MKHIVQPKSGIGLELRQGQCLRVVDPEGGQVADLVAFASDDSGEWLSNGRTFDYNATFRLTRGHVLYSNRSNPMFTIVEDTVGRHDFLYTACSREMFEIQYGLADHPNCLDNLAANLAHLGVNRDRIPTPFNIFMNVEMAPSGELSIRPPKSTAGDSIVLRAEMDLAVAVAACAAGACNGGRNGPVHLEVVN
jgi:uncharacterized protein YcgI (DUF1989 family)